MPLLYQVFNKFFTFFTPSGTMYLRPDGTHTYVRE